MKNIINKVIFIKNFNNIIIILTWILKKNMHIIKKLN
jgi:hypothetical protein